MTNTKNEKREDFNIRKCEGFNPANHLIEIPALDGSGTELYLKVQERIAWFLQYCEEKGIAGVIDESDVRYIPEAQMFQVTAKVYMDKHLVATGVGCAYYTPGGDCTRTPVQDAATIAKGRALSNTGFGTKMCYSDEPEKTPCETGEKIPDSTPPQNLNPLIPTTKQTTPVQEKPEQPKQAAIPTTLEEARLVRLESSTYKGKTLGEMAALNPSFLHFLAEKYSCGDKHPEYVEGAKIILANL